MVAGAALLVVFAGAILTLPPTAQVGLLGGSIATAWFFSKPRQALIAVFVGRILVDLLWFLPFRIAGLNIREAYGGGVTLLLAALLFLEIKRVDRHPAIAAFVPYMIAMAIGGLRNLEVRAAAEIIAKYVGPVFILFLMSGFFETRKQREQLVRWTLAIFFVPVVLAMFHYANGQMDTYVRDGYHRLIGAYQHPHNHALMLVIIAAASVWWLMQQQTWRARVLPGALLLMSSFALYNTYVRTGQLALVVFGACYLWLTGRKRTLAAGALAVAVFIAATPAMQDRFKDLILFFVPDSQDTIARARLGSGRLSIWTASIGAYLDSSPADIVLGQGIGKHWMLTRGAYNPYQISDDLTRDAHSDYLTMTFQVGPVATVAYLIIQLQVVRYALRVRAAATTRAVREFACFVAALMVGATVANIVSNSFINRVTQSWMLWGFSGLVFAEHQQLIREGRIRRPQAALARMRAALQPAGRGGPGPVGGPPPPPR